MRAVVQRVSKASVTVAGEPISAIQEGLLVLVGVSEWDDETDAIWLAEKIVRLRIFSDEHEKMNLSLIDVGGSLLAVSQFTLFGDCRKGLRPSFSGAEAKEKRPALPAAASPKKAERLYQLFCETVNQIGIPLATGEFQAHMEVDLVNDGPVTFYLTSPREEERAYER